MIDDVEIAELLNQKSDESQVLEILNKTNQLQSLSLKEVAILLNTKDPDLLLKIYQQAKLVKENIYGKRLVIFAPLYISNYCNNDCLYCAFRSSNKNVARSALNKTEILNETKALLKTGQKRILLVSGEAYPDKKGLDYILNAIDTIYSAKDGANQIRRINVNIAPLSIEDFKKLKQAKIGTYQLFQETYHKDTYQKMHPKGPKSDYQYRLSAIDRAFESGIDDLGLGVLFGLYDYKFEVLALLSHIKYLEKKYGLGPHTISVPRIEPAAGSEIASMPPYRLTDTQFKKLIAILRLAVPYTGIILSTRENELTRNACLELGVSQISAGSKTNPGGYSDKSGLEQFCLGDHRNLDEVIFDICQKGYLPSFCTSCYRLGRTGLDFMEYAKPGDIKQKCQPNGLFTFMEYLLDYASQKTKLIGEKLIAKELADLPSSLREKTETIIAEIKKGKRDICY